MAKSTIKFGKRITDGPGNNVCFPILRNGVEVGTIEGSYDDIGVTSTIYRMCLYSVTFYAADVDDGADKDFAFNPRADVARENLKAAKDYARKVLLS